MGLFGGLRNTFKQSEAAVVVQNLLEPHASSGMLSLDPANLANRLVGILWQLMPDLLSGKFGQRPHKIAVAAAALANGIRLLDDEDPTELALVVSLGTIFSEIRKNGRLYPFNNVDHVLLEKAASIFANSSLMAQQPSSSEASSEKVEAPEFEAWEDWYEAFKVAAGEANPQLAVKEDGRSFLDYMEHEPLQRAFRDGKNPRSLAKGFAAQFDIGEVLRNS